jgi:hypothetical protein
MTNISAEQNVELGVRHLGHVRGVGNHPVRSGDAVDKAFMPSVCALLVKEHRVGITIFLRCDSCSLPCNGAAEGGEV